MSKRNLLLLLLGLALIVTLFTVTGCTKSDKVTINRDGFGVPHIYANSVEGLYYGFGYAVAQDRLFQLEMLKRTYWGRTAEIYGPNYVVLDAAMRRDNPTLDELKTLFAKLEPDYQKRIIAYAEGINAWIEKVKADKDNKLPLEFHTYKFEPEFWSEYDAVTPYLLIMGLFMDVSNEVLNADLLTYLVKKYGNEKGQRYFKDMAWVEDPSAIVTIKDNSMPASTSTRIKNQLKYLNTAGIRQAAESVRKEKERNTGFLDDLGFKIPEKFLNDSFKSFSYTLVLGKEKSASGEPILMGGPQFGFWLPSMVHEVGLHGAGIDVVGSTLVGSPFIMFGHNKVSAFTSTAGAGNIEDVFEEKLNPENPLEYKYNGQWVKMVERVEEIKIANEVEPQEVKVYNTVHGPVFQQVDTDGDGKYDVAYSKKLACRDDFLSGIEAYTKQMTAETPEQFLAAGKVNALSLNFFYADKNGNIGYYHCGKYPIRANVDVRIPTPGTGEFEWQGFIPTENNPMVINPSTSYLANWNNNPAHHFNNGDLSSIFSWTGWGPDHRALSIVNLVEKAERPLSVEDVQRVIHDIADYDLRTMSIKPYLMEALAGVEDAEIIKVKEYLLSWDDHRTDANKDGYYDSPGITIWDKWWKEINYDIFYDKINSRWTTLADNYAGYSLFLRVLQGSSAVIPVEGDYLSGKDKKQILLDAMYAAIANLKKDYNTCDMSKWLTETKKMDLVPTNMLIVPSSLGTVPAIKYMDRGTENHIVLLGESKVKGQNVLPAGNSGFINKDGERDKHFADQLPLFESWAYKDMLFEKEEIEQSREVTSSLKYKFKQ